MTSSLPLPPGSSGWPLVGEAAGIASNPFGFMASRAAQHGPVARSRLLDRDLAILSGPDAATAFLDEANVERAGGLPPHAAALFGLGVSNQIDGAAHRTRKQHLMRALDHEALAHYLPTMRTIVRERLAAWSARGELDLQDDAILLTQKLNFATLAGATPDEAALARYAKGYADFGKALFGLPLAFPGSPLRRARAFTADMHAWFSELVEARKSTPTGDGISRLLASDVEGARMDARDIVLELHHLLFAGGGLWSWFCFGTRTLSEDAALAERLRAAVAALPPEPSGRVLLECAELVAFVREVKRLAPLIPITAMGVARRDFEVAGHQVPKGWLVLWATCASHTVPNVAPYTSPERFDPSRYGRGEGEGPHHFAPQGPGEALTSHRCAGVEYSTLACLVFFSELVRGPRVSLPSQDLALDFSTIPARYRRGLRVRFGG
jgi:cytochrome P450